MASGWLISYIALWCLVLAMGLVILAHSRLLGLLHHRFGPAGAKALADGPKIGERLDSISRARPDGSGWTWTFPARSDLMLIFVSPQCQSCDALMPHIKDFVRTHKEIQVALFSALPDRAMNTAFIDYRALHEIVYLMADGLDEQLEVEGTPYAIRVNRKGTVRAKGLVNHYEHLLSLLIEPALPPAPEAKTQESEPAANAKEEEKHEEHEAAIGTRQAFL
jgi:methylamine dehydrogenase accessory protein MauD